jgi:hypothetical protein
MYNSAAATIPNGDTLITGGGSSAVYNLLIQNLKSFQDLV